MELGWTCLWLAFIHDTSQTLGRDVTDMAASPM